MNKTTRIVALAVATLSLLWLLSACESTTDTDNNSYKPNYLILVNKDNLIPDDYVSTIHLRDIDNVDGGSCQVEKRTKSAFKKLQSYLKKQGIEIGVDSAYRSVEEQQKVMDEFTEKYGEEYARNTVAIPGTSEHHTGLVIDLVPKVNGAWVIENEDMLKETSIFLKIHKALPEFGFILRYPKNKTAITGYDYEPWHIRYVGRKAAREIYDRKITLEEYLAK